jgi:hypothetical protein
LIQKDYILRIAEDVGRALAQIIYHKEIQDYPGLTKPPECSTWVACGAIGKAIAMATIHKPTISQR